MKQQPTLTLRDQLAMSLPADLIPTLNTTAIKSVNECFGLEWDDDDLLKQIEWNFKYQAIMRYSYADAMLASR